MGLWLIKIELKKSTVAYTWNGSYTVVGEITWLAWEGNIAIIRKQNLEHDLGSHSYTLGLNKYADL